MASEDAKHDGNYQPTLIAEDQATGEVRRIKSVEGGLKTTGRLIYLGSQVITGAPVAATIPEGTTVFVIQSSTAIVTFTINAAYDVAACGYLAAGAQIKIGPLSLLTELNCTSAGNIHLMYFKEA